MSDSSDLNILTALLVFLTAYYAFQARKSVDEMVKARKSQFTPALKVETTRFLLGADLSVKISNIGIGTAKNIKGKLKLEPDGEEIDIVYSLLYPRDSFALMTPFKSVKSLTESMQYRELELSVVCEDILGTTYEIKDVFSLDDMDKIKNDDHTKNKMIDELKNIRKEISDLKKVIQAKSR